MLDSLDGHLGLAIQKNILGVRVTAEGQEEAETLLLGSGTAAERQNRRSGMTYIISGVPITVDKEWVREEVPKLAVAEDGSLWEIDPIVSFGITYEKPVWNIVQGKKVWTKAKSTCCWKIRAWTEPDMNHSVLPIQTPDMQDYMMVINRERPREYKATEQKKTIWKGSGKGNKIQYPEDYGGSQTVRQLAQKVVVEEEKEEETDPEEDEGMKEDEENPSPARKIAKTPKTMATRIRKAATPQAREGTEMREFLELMKGSMDQMNLSMAEIKSEVITIQKDNAVLRKEQDEITAQIIATKRSETEKDRERTPRK